MARPRSPNREEAKRKWLMSGGTISTAELAESLGVKAYRIRKWKSEDGWQQELDKKTRGGQRGNKNAVGHGAPIRNSNAETHGAYAQVYLDQLSPEERAYIAGVTLDARENMLRELQLLLAKEGDLKRKMSEYERAVRGFHLNSLASLFVEWREIVEKFLDANQQKKKGNIEQLKAWTNTEMGQTWEEEGKEMDHELLYHRREKYHCEVPADVVCLTAGIDTQDDRFEVEVVGWGEEKESWGIRYKIIYGDLKQKPVWEQLDAFLGQTFTRADGAKLKIIRACIDSGGHFSNDVYRFCKGRFPLVLAIRGKGGAEAPYIPRASKNNREQTPLFTLGVDTGKALIYQSLAVTEEGANYCHFPREKDRGYDEAYFKGLTAERMVLTYKKGRAQYVWKLKQNGTKRNEPLDCRNYAQAALEISSVVLQKQNQTEIAAQTTKKSGRRTRSGGVT